MNHLPSTTQLLLEGIDHRLHIGAQVYVWHAGETVADFALGDAAPGVAMTTDTINLWLSTGKPVMSVAVAMLWEQGLLDMDDPVTRFIPEFGAGGKESITVRRLLTHTGGFRMVESEWSLDPWDIIIQRICASEIERGWIPGQKAGYHMGSSWYILGEIVRRLSGVSFDLFARQQIFLPLGMKDTWMAMPVEVQSQVQDRLGVMVKTEGGDIQPLPRELDPVARSLSRPGSTARGPIREAGLFYQMLYNKGILNGVRILNPQTVEALTARHRTGMKDYTFHHTLDWGLGFLIDSNQYGADTVPYSYGRHCSPRTYGHSGLQSSTAFCDPDNHLVVAWLTNGQPGIRQHNDRQREINSAIYEDLGLDNNINNDHRIRS